MRIKIFLLTMLFSSLLYLMPAISEAQLNSVRISGPPPSYYSTIQSAYDAAQNGDTIESQGIVFFEDLYLDDVANKSITLEGGYDDGFSVITGSTVINGNMIISTGMITTMNGSLTIAGFVYNIPDTGQTQSYTDTFGEDSDYRLNFLSYTENGNETVTDNVTGLMWQQIPDSLTYNWYVASGTYDTFYNPESEDICANSTLAGYSDWRLPNEIELMGIVNYGVHSPSIDLIFPNTGFIHYWSSSPFSNNLYTAWSVIFNNGHVTYSYYKSFEGKARCVRGNNAVGVFIDNVDGTVTDKATGLMWQTNDDDTLKTWEASIIYCEDLTFPPLTYSDWRLPNIKELRSIVDNSAYKPAIGLSFPSTKPFYYWSSTTVDYWPSDAWRIDFYTGTLHMWNKPSDGYVRCVRGGL